MSDEQFEQVLEEEVSNSMDQLPLERACNSSGWPTEEEVVNVSKDDEDEEQIVAQFEVFFYETRQSSCSDLEVNDPRNASFVITINKADRTYDIEFQDSDAAEEF